MPYLLNLAGDFNEWLTHFPPAPAATLALLRKLDHCFASLLDGRDVDTHEPLPGFEDGRRRAGLTGTDMVRCRSTVEQTRRLVVDVMSNEAPEDEDDQDDNPGAWMTDTEAETDGSVARVGVWEEDEDRLHMDVARVYENTLVQLGARLGDGGGVGAVQMTNDWEALGKSC